MTRDFSSNRAIEAGRDRTADGFIIVTPEYNHGYSAVLKNAIDYVYDGWNKKPVAFVSYGGPAGGSRAIEQLRQVAIELQMHPVREQVTIPYIWSALSDSGELIDEGEHFKHGAERFVEYFPKPLFSDLPQSIFSYRRTIRKIFSPTSLNSS